jgi:hypothetical protein
MADEKTYHIKFPGNITLEVHLQKPHPVNLTVRFPDQVSGVTFSYSPEGAGVASHFGSVVHEHGTSDPENRVRPATAPSLGTDVAIQYNDPGGSRM